MIIEMVIPKKIKVLFEKFEKNGAEIWLVGGAVRDLMMGREVKDWDLTTNLEPEKVLAMFAGNSFYNNVYGMVGIVLDGEVVEVTTYRTEHEYDDHRHPTKVAWGKSFREDAERRDFTINAMAMNLQGKIVDFFGGQDDLKSKLVRAVGNPDERFSEDALRMMRAIRIATQVDFKVEEETFASIKRNAKLINKIAGERVRDEIFKILSTARPSNGVELLKNSGLLEEVMPEILEGVGVEQKGHHIYNVWEHLIETLNNCESLDPVTRLAALLHDVAKPEVMKGTGEARTFHNHEVVGSRIAVRIGKRLKLSNKDLDKLFRLVRWHMFTVAEMQTDAAVRRFIRNVTPEYLNEMIALRRADRLGSGARESSWRWELFKKRLIEVQKQPFSVKDLKIDGHDVMKVLNIGPGRKVGEILDNIFAEVEKDPSTNQREILIDKLKSLLVT